MPVVEEFESLSEELAKVIAECERLRAENERLRRALVGLELRKEEKRQTRIPTGDVARQRSVPRPVRNCRCRRKSFYSVRSFAGGRTSTQSSGLDRTGTSATLPRAFATGEAVRSVLEAERKKIDKATRRLLAMTEKQFMRSFRQMHGRLIHCADDTVGFLRWTSIWSRGSSTRFHFWNRAANGMFLPCWSVPDQATDTCLGVLRRLTLSWPQAATSVRDSTIRAWTRCFW